MAWSMTVRNDIRTAAGSTKVDLVVDFADSVAADAISLEHGGVLLVLEGMVLNSDELMRTSGESSLGRAIISRYRAVGPQSIGEISGSFCGALHDRRDTVFFGFTNKVGDRALFYGSRESVAYISNNFKDVLRLYSDTGPIRPDRNAAYYMMTYGFMIDNSTHVEGIARLGPGEFVFVDRAGTHVQQYHKFVNDSDNRVDSREAIEELDTRFRNSVTKILDKDKEYGGSSVLADMSGGFDSRITTWVAKELGASEITNMCYAQNGSADARFAKGVADHLGNDFLFMPLDSHRFMYDVDKIVELNSGLGLYVGITGGERFLRCLSPDAFGLELTGLMGDVIVGSYVQGDAQDEPPRFNFGAYSSRLGFDFDQTILSRYSNLEMFAIYTSGFRGVLSSVLTRNKYFDVASPFLDEDFLEFCMSLPPSIRAKHRLYNAWLTQKYPEAAGLPSTRYGSRVTNSQSRNLVNRVAMFGPDEVLHRLGRRTGRSLGRKSASMHPFDAWYRTSSPLRSFYEDYFERDLHRLDGDAPLRQAAVHMFNFGTVRERAQVLTVLASYRQFGLHF